MITWIIIAVLIGAVIIKGLSETTVSQPEGFECPKRWVYETHKGVIGNSVPPKLTVRPEGLDKYPPPSLPPQGAPQPPVSNWKPYVNYYYYDPWWAYSYPYNRLCDAMARRNCNGSWYPRDCFREQYNKCVMEKLA